MGKISKTFQKESLDFLKEIKYYIVLSIVYILFSSFFENLILKYISKPFLSQCNRNIFIDLIFLVALFAIILNFIIKYKRNYLISNKHIAINSILLLFYLYYRIEYILFENTSTFVDYTPTIIPIVKYFDIIPIYLFSNILIRFFYTKEKHDNDKESNEGFYFDEPLDEKKQDLLRREELAKYIADKLNYTCSEKSSFTIGIVGEWGSGKSSFFKLIKNQINEKDKIIIEFNPWYNYSEESIIKDFFNLLNNKLSKYNSEISSNINRYTEILVEVDDNYASKILNPISKSLNSKKTVADEFVEIRDAILNTGKKIVIFIDDIDRLNNDEIFQVIKLIRNTANFANTTFIVAYEKQYLVNAINNINNSKPEIFLEKIFQLEIRLPNIEKDIILNKLFELINPHIIEEHKEAFKCILFKGEPPYDDEIFKCDVINTFRDVTRFANSFLFSYRFLKEETVLSDLLNLELLNLKFLDVYKLIFNKPGEFLDTELKDKKNLYKLRLVEPGHKFVIEEYLKRYYNKYSLQENQIQDVINILRVVFLNNSITVNKRNYLISVVNPASFKRYSIFRLQDSNLSYIEFSNYRLKKPLNEFKEKVNEWVNAGKIQELYEFLIEIEEYSDRNDFEKIISILFHYARLPRINYYKNETLGFDFHILFDKLWGYKNNIIEKFYDNDKEQYSSFIISILNGIKSPTKFDSSFVDRLLEINEFLETIPENKLEEIQLNYFKMHLAEIDKINSITWLIFNNCSIKKKNRKTSKDNQIDGIREPEIVELFKGFIRKKALKSFLEWMVDIEPFEKKTFKVHTMIKIMFGSYEGLNNSLKEFKVSEHAYLDEFNDFYEKVSKNGYINFIPYKFEKLDIFNRE